MPVADWNNVIILIIAALNAVTAYLAWRTHKLTEQTRADVGLVEKATNSMKDALVAATDKAARAEGIAQGRQNQKDDDK